MEDYESAVGGGAADDHAAHERVESGYRLDEAYGDIVFKADGGKGSAALCEWGEGKAVLPGSQEGRGGAAGDRGFFEQSVSGENGHDVKYDGAAESTFRGGYGRTA